MNPPPPVPDHELLRVIGRGSYGEVWLARNIMGVLRAVKVVHRSKFDRDRPYEPEFSGIQRYEPLSRTSDGLVQVLHVGRNDSARCFYYVMELADDANDSADVFVRAGTGTACRCLPVSTRDRRSARTDRGRRTDLLDLGRARLDRGSQASGRTGQYGGGHRRVQPGFCLAGSP